MTDVFILNEKDIVGLLTAIGEEEQIFIRDCGKRELKIMVAE